MRDAFFVSEDLVYPIQGYVVRQDAASWFGTERHIFLTRKLNTTTNHYTKNGIKNCEDTVYDVHKSL